jgi:hypothetical protein
MKRILFCLLAAFVLMGCEMFKSTTTKSAASNPSEPLWRFESVDTAGLTLKDSFVMNDFVSDGVVFSKASREYSMANFLAEMNILQELDYETFYYLSDLLFTNLPIEGQVKQVVLPNITKQALSPIFIKDVYLFITKTKDNENHAIYRIDSNIPLGAARNNIKLRYFDMRQGCYNGFIPGNDLTGTVYLSFNKDLLVFQGYFYPTFIAPLWKTEKGLMPDSNFKHLLSGEHTLAQTKVKLEWDASVAIRDMNGKNESPEFMTKFTLISLAAYSFLDDDCEEAVRCFESAINTECPPQQESLTFFAYNNLEVIMHYVLMASLETA